MILFSTPLVSTWSFYDKARLMIDCGDGASALLGSKIHKVDFIALTHAHRDHIGGLLQFLNLRGGSGGLTVLYPASSGSFPALETFLGEFDAVTSGKVRWVAVEDSYSIDIGGGKLLQVFASDHITHLGPGRSMGYKVVHQAKKLRSEFLNAGEDVPSLVRKLGEDAVFKLEETIDAAFCGDGLPIDSTRVAAAKILVVECTFLTPQVSTRDHRHVCLEEVHEFVCSIKPGKVVINHISARYSKEEIRERIEALVWPCEVSVVFPGELTHVQ